MSATVHVELTVNGERREADVEARLLLVHWLREHLGLTGTHVGCDTTNCGACTIHMDGESKTGKPDRAMWDLAGGKGS